MIVLFNLVEIIVQLSRRATVFGIAGAMYLLVNGILTLIFRQVEKRALAFEVAN